MASIQVRKGRRPRIIRWVYEIGASGEEVRRARYLTCVSQAHADAQLDAYRLADARGEGDAWWEREQQLARAKRVSISVLRAGIDWVTRGSAETTRLHRRVCLERLRGWRNTEELGDLATSALSTAVVLDYWDWLGRKVSAGDLAESTAYRYVQALYQVWRFAFDQPDKYPGTPRPPSRLVDLGIRPPPPPIATATPTWVDVDAMLACLDEEWQRRAVIVMRYTGCRVSQALNLRWGDVDLVGGHLHLRRTLRGGKRKGDRLLPLHQDLLRRLKTWEPRGHDALVIQGVVRKDGTERPQAYVLLNRALRQAWTAAGVDERKWGKSGSRGNGRSAHCIRASFKSGLLRAGGLDSDVDYLIGHARGQTDGAYVSQAEGGPLWDRARATLACIPDIATGDPEDRTEAMTVEVGDDVDLDDDAFDTGDCDGEWVVGEVAASQARANGLVLIKGGIQ